MRNILWNELARAKFNEIYASLLIGHYRYWLNAINLIIVFFSTAGVMGWNIWNIVPFIACVIIAVISLLKLVMPYLIPSEKQIEKYDKIADFYCDFYLKLEYIWFSFENNRISEEEMQQQYYDLKQNEREINKLISQSLIIY
jgi:hypothetical protein